MSGPVIDGCGGPGGWDARWVGADIAPCGCPYDWVDHDGFCACCEAHLHDPDGLYAIQGDGSHGFLECPARQPTHYDSRGQRDMRTGEPKFVRQRAINEPAPTIAGQSRNDAWVTERPATTVAGDPRVHPPGHKVNAEDLAAGRDDYEGRAGTNAVRVSIEEALVLQSFPPDYPVQGNKTAAFRQCGDAMPPLLAWHVLRAVVA